MTQPYLIQVTYSFDPHWLNTSEITSCIAWGKKPKGKEADWAPGLSLSGQGGTKELMLQEHVRKVAHILADQRAPEESKGRCQLQCTLLMTYALCQLSITPSRFPSSRTRGGTNVQIPHSNQKRLRRA